MKAWFHRTATTLTLLLLPLAATAAAAPGGPTRGPEQKLLWKIHQTNLAEMKAGEIAQTKGESVKVREYGRRLYNDHHFADEKITALAAGKGIALTPPKHPTLEEKNREAQHGEVMHHLQQVKGRTFDVDFLAAMVDGHKQAISLLSAEVKTLPDADVRALVEHLIPILEQHETIAENLQREEPAGATGGT